MQVIKAVDNVHGGSYIGLGVTGLGTRTPCVQFIDYTKLLLSISMMHTIKKLIRECKQQLRGLIFS